MERRKIETKRRKIWDKEEENREKEEENRDKEEENRRQRGEKFDVLEMTFNKKTGLTEYKEIGTATVDKKEVWDNRYNAGEKIEPVLDKDGQPIIATSFKGSKKIQPGMLLKKKIIINK